MHSIESNPPMLSNWEVFRHLQKIKDSKKKHKGQLATITYETLRYLEDTPCKGQTADNVEKCLRAFEPYNLTKKEKLMLINIAPTSPLGIQLIVEESEEKLTEEQVTQILEIIAENFPHVVVATEEPAQTETNS